MEVIKFSRLISILTVTEDFMTDKLIEETIEAVQAAIKERNNGRARYSKELREKVISAVHAIGPAQFSERSGLGQGLIHKWRKKLAKRRSSCEVDLKSPPKYRTPLRVRELTVTPSPSGFAIIRSGSGLEVQVPLAVVTPAWIIDVLQHSAPQKEVTHV
jgi:transposase-like protein